MNRRFHSAALVVAIVGVLAGSATLAQSTVGLDRSQARIATATAGVPLAAASKAAPSSVVAGYLQAQGRGADVLESLRVTTTSVSASGVSHLRFEQQVDGLTVHGAYAKAAVNGKGELVQVIDHLAPVTLVQPSRIDAAQAVAAALKKLYPAQAANLRATSVKGNTTEFAGGAFFHRGPSATAVVLPLEDGSLARGWVVETWTARDNQLHYTVVNGTGQVLDVESRTNTDSYNVFVEDPGKAAQAVVTGPGTTGNAQSPSGWLGSGAQTTVNIQGNNVRAYLDANADNVPDAGGTAVTSGNFVATANLAEQPSTTANRAVAVQNLFYLNNIVHDRLYAHGFNEANGNFQLNNFGKGGAGNDPVNAEAQDGSGTDNANFSTPVDGSSPRMQMYLWSSASPTHEVVSGATYGAYGAQFGAALTTTGLTGTLAAPVDGGGVSATDGCEAIATSLAGRIAIVDRGTCNFTTKVLNAQNAGAVAVIIANNDGSPPFSMGGTDRKVRISSVMVSQADGVTLKARAGNPATERLKLVQPVQIDGDLDSDIVYHEYGHGLTWRMIGSMSGVFAGAIGEGASDVVAFLINGDDAVGEYSYSSPIGIRRYAYGSHPLTYKNWTGAAVHDDGEIYAAAMWRLLKLYEAKGLTANDLMADFVDGMNFTPAAPKPENMRDGMLTSVGQRFATNGTARCNRVDSIWRAFAERGIGVGATGTVSRRGVLTITESFATPAACTP